MLDMTWLALLAVALLAGTLAALVWAAHAVWRRIIRAHRAHRFSSQLEACEDISGTARAEDDT